MNSLVDYRKANRFHWAVLVLAVLVIVLAGFLLVDVWEAYLDPVIVIEWETASEMNTVGFNLYRSESPIGGQEVKINADFIPPASDPLVGGSYSFSDNGVQQNHKYYYWLEEVDSSGAVSRIPLEPVTVDAGGWQGLLGVGMLVAAGVILFVGLHGEVNRRRKSEQS